MLQTFGERKRKSRIKAAFLCCECDGMAALENEIRFSAIMNFLWHFSRLAFTFLEKKKKSFKLCWTLNDNHAISLKGFLWHFYVSINVNKASEIHSRGPCVVSWHCLLATSCPFMSSVLAELSPSCFLSLSVSICRFAQTHSNKKSFFFLPTPPKSLL